MQLNILAIVGSLRSASVNRATARAAIAVAPDDVSITILPIGDVPLYNGDVEDRGVPDAVTALHDAVDAADGVIFFTPEYNGSLPAVTKNVIDWLSRPPQALEQTPLAGVATTPGGRAGAEVLGHFEQIFDHMRAEYPRFESLGIGSYGDKLDEQGEIADDATRAEIADWIENFVTFVNSYSPS